MKKTLLSCLLASTCVIVLFVAILSTQIASAQTSSAEVEVRTTETGVTITIPTSVIPVDEQIKRETNQNIEERKAEAERKRLEAEENIQKKREEIQRNIDAKQAEAQLKREEVRTNIDEKRAEIQARNIVRIKMLVEQMFNRFYVANQRLADIAERMSLKFEEFREKGVNTDSASNKLIEAKSAISKLNSEIEESKSAALDTIKEDVDRETLRSIIEELRKKIENAKKLLVESLRLFNASVKESDVLEQDENSSTDQSTENNVSNEN